MKKLRGVKSLDRPRSSTSDTDNGLHFRDILGVKIRRYREKAPCQGIDIYVHDRKEPNRYKERTLLLGHPSEEICVAWIKKIEQGLEGLYITAIHISLPYQADGLRFYHLNLY